MAKKKLPCPQCDALMSGKKRGISVMREGIRFLTTPKVYKCKKCGHQHITAKERNKMKRQVDKDYPDALKIHEREKLKKAGEVNEEERAK